MHCLFIFFFPFLRSNKFASLSIRQQTDKQQCGSPPRQACKTNCGSICQRGQTKLGVCLMRPKESVWRKGIQSGTGTHRRTHTVAFSLPCVRTKHRICTYEWHIFAIAGTTSFPQHPRSAASKHVSCRDNGQSCAGRMMCISCTLMLP